MITYYTREEFFSHRRFGRLDNAIEQFFTEYPTAETVTDIHEDDEGFYGVRGVADEKIVSGNYC